MHQQCMNMITLFRTSEKRHEEHQNPSSWAARIGFFFGPMPIAVVACFLAVVELVSCPYRSIKLIGCASRQPATWLRLGLLNVWMWGSIQPRIRWVKHGELLLPWLGSCDLHLRSPRIAVWMTTFVGSQNLLILPSFCALFNEFNDLLFIIWSFVGSQNLFISNFGALSPWMCNDSYCCQKAFFPKVLITCDHTARTVRMTYSIELFFVLDVVSILSLGCLWYMIL